MLFNSLLNSCSQKKQTQTKRYDRFIPMRQSSEQYEQIHQSLVPSRMKSNHLDIGKNKVLFFNEKTPATIKSAVNSGPSFPKKKRVIPRTCDNCLDAPNLKPNFYFNLIDWSVDNQLAVALANEIFVWDAASAEIGQLPLREKQDWSSVSWAPKGGKYLALGSEEGAVEIYDVIAGKRSRKMTMSNDRVLAMQWSPSSPSLLASANGTKITISDVRIREHTIGTLTNGHEQEVCGLKWSATGNQIASGGNDCLVCLWDVSLSKEQNRPKNILRGHSSGVKAVAWCPWQSNLLASGGGNADQTIRFWDTNNGDQLNIVNTSSQISSLQWSPNPICKEIVSTHGYSNCEVNVWNYPSLTKAAELTGHSERILSSCTSPDGSTVCTAGADEALRFWNIWPARSKKKLEPKANQSSAFRFRELR
jgi:cell division cycle protein 20 (cofactor of APC complex)